MAPNNSAFKLLVRTGRSVRRVAETKLWIAIVWN